MRLGKLLAFFIALSLSACAQSKVLAETKAKPADALNCESRPELRQQSRDAATIQKLENAWSRAFLKGDADFMKCLLVPGFTEILRSGDVKDLAYEMDLALRNRGKDLPVPDFPPESILLHGDVAVAYGETIPPSDQPRRRTRFADFYVWTDGGWRVFFAQQTAIRDQS